MVSTRPGSSTSGLHASNAPVCGSRATSDAASLGPGSAGTKNWPPTMSQPSCSASARTVGGGSANNGDLKLGSGLRLAVSATTPGELVPRTNWKLPATATPADDTASVVEACSVDGSGCQSTMSPLGSAMAIHGLSR